MINFHYFLIYFLYSLLISFIGGKVGINSKSYGGLSLNHSCFNALLAVILLDGSIYSISFINFNPFSLITPLLILSENLSPGYF